MLEIEICQAIECCIEKIIRYWNFINFNQRHSTYYSYLRWYWFMLGQRNHWRWIQCVGKSIMPRCCWILENYDKIQVLYICRIRMWFCFEELQRIGYCYPLIYILKTRLWIGQANCWRLIKTTLVLWIMLLYLLFPIHDNALFWPYGSILSNFGAALIDILSLAPDASFW